MRKKNLFYHSLLFFTLKLSSVVINSANFAYPNIKIKSKMKKNLFDILDLFLSALNHLFFFNRITKHRVASYLIKNVSRVNLAPNLNYLHDCLR